jgi:hypothetical protein
MSMRRLGSIALIITVAVSPLACNTDDPHPSVPGGGSASAAGARVDGGDRNSDGEPQGGADSTGMPEGGADAAGGAGSELSPIGVLGGQGPVAGGGAPSSGPADCDAATDWGNIESLASVSTEAADERLLAMTHDELTLVFTRDDLPMVADRADADADFGAPIALTLPSGFTLEHGATLGPDGLSLVLVSTDRAELAQVKRPARSGAFGTALDKARFARINDNNQFVHAYLAGPVLSQSGATLFFTQIAGSTSQVFRADGQDTLVRREMSEDTVTLGGEEGDAKLTVSVSADLRTLFVFDEALGHVTGLWNSAVGGPYTQATPFTNLESAFASEGCGRLYGTLRVEGSLDVVVETPN